MQYRSDDERMKKGMEIEGGERDICRRRTREFEKMRALRGISCAP
jgi:hypothetical protein